jgi:hypothetical protein
MSESATTGQSRNDDPPTPRQLALLEDFMLQAGMSAINRPFRLVDGSPRRLERNGIVIKTEITDEELLSLSATGYLNYTAMDRSVTFSARALNRIAQIGPAPSPHSGSGSRMRLGRIRFASGKRAWLTIARPFFVLVALALILLYVTGILSSAAIQTWTATIVLLLAAIGLQIRRRGT